MLSSGAVPHGCFLRCGPNERFRGNIEIRRRASVWKSRTQTLVARAIMTSRLLVPLLVTCLVFVNVAAADECRRNELGTSAALEIPDIELQPIASQETLGAGALWTIYSRLRNRTVNPIWIVERTTTLDVPPELWGISSDAGSVHAFFGTKKRDSSDRILRLDPGATYTVSWKIDPFHEKRSSGSAFATFRRLLFLLGEYLFFQPGEYSLASNTHIWSTPPCVKDKEVVNFGDSVVLSESAKITVNTPQPVLIFGAVVGGIACFALQILLRIRRTSFRTAGGVRFLLLGFFTAILLCSLGTILASRLSAPDFLIAVRVQDFWGAIATGFVIQWFGLRYLSQRLDSLLNTADPTPVEKTQQPNSSD